MRTRIERDSLGDVEVPADRLWGAQTERARQHFRIGVALMPIDIVHALACIKFAAADANESFGVLPPDLARAIREASLEVIEGRLDNHFPLAVWQSGSGTQTNMNVNEVIANRANQRLGACLGSKHPVHPNDHVNRSQSSNDTFPTAVHLAVERAWRERLRPAILALEQTLRGRAEMARDIVKLGRTHLQDAVPLTVGQEISAWAAQLAAARLATERVADGLCELAIGGTAVGTGLNAPAGFGERVASSLAAVTGAPLVVAPDRRAALAGAEALTAFHGGLVTIATALHKLANDVRYLASGPRAGLGELSIPANEPGSSIMPGKINPTQAEALTMVCGRVLGNATTVAFGAANGQLQLNTYRPMMAAAVLESVQLLADASASFDEHCARGIEPNRARVAFLLEQSLMLVTALVPRLGYDRAAAIALRAQQSGTTLREAALATSALSAEEFDTLVRPDAMIPE